MKRTPCYGPIYRDSLIKRVEIPNSWYAIIFTSMLAIAMTLCYTTEANLPWWALLLAVALAAVMVLPIGRCGRKSRFVSSQNAASC
jgi:hypothetical protein